MGQLTIESNGKVYAPLHDFSGHIIALIADDKIVETCEINAFGEEKNPPQDPINPWRFSSKRSDEGLVFFGKWFYDPSLRRWLTPNPSGFTDGANLYAYVLNNPLNRIDLFGLLGEDLQPFRNGRQSKLGYMPEGYASDFLLLDCNIQVIPCLTPWYSMMDHAFLGDTYSAHRTQYFNNLRERRGFYDGKMR